MSALPFGIDISKYQNPDLIDYDKIAEQVDFVIMRVGFGWLKDVHFERHYQEFTQRNVPIGGYHFPLNTRLQEQADMVKQALGGKRIEAGLWVDVEATYQSRSEINAYIPILENTIGTEVGIYTSYSKWLEIMQNETRWASRRLWVANYGVTVPRLPSPWKKWCLWQYSSTGRLNGYSGNLDLDWANADCLSSIPAIGEEAPPEPPTEPKLFDAKVVTTPPNRLKTRFTPAGLERPEADWLPSQAIVPVYETHSTGWWRVADEAWSSATWMRRVDNLPLPPPMSGNYAYYGPVYNQRDIRWAAHPLGTKSTIGANGCLMTCASMVCNHFGHASNPLQLNNWLTDNGGYLDGNLFLWDAIGRLYSDMKFDGFVYSPTTAQIRAAIQAGTLPIMFVDFNDDTPLIEMHWVAGVGVTNTDVLIADPWTGTMGRLADMYPKNVIRIGSYRRQA